MISTPARRHTVDREGGIAAARMTTDFDTKRTENWLAGSLAGRGREAERAYGQSASMRSGPRMRSRRPATCARPRVVIDERDALFAWAAKEALQQAPDANMRMVDISGGSCDVCAPYQGTWSMAQLDQLASLSPSLRVSGGGWLVSVNVANVSGSVIHKSFDLVEVKADDDATGSFTALASVFGNVDAGGDRMVRGAFKNTLERWREKGDPIPIIYSSRLG